jgi:ATP-binding cassette subfamily C (CFTR/MRP) protein 1
MTFFIESLLLLIIIIDWYRYSIVQALAGTLFLTIQLIVGVSSLTTYVILGNTLDVATALTSLALLEILRFPLFMLPTVINNLVEAKVSGRNKNNIYTLQI